MGFARSPNTPRRAATNSAATIAVGSKARAVRSPRRFRTTTYAAPTTAHPAPVRTTIGTNAHGTTGSTPSKATTATPIQAIHATDAPRHGPLDRSSATTRGTRAIHASSPAPHGLAAMLKKAALTSARPTGPISATAPVPVRAARRCEPARTGLV